MEQSYVRLVDGEQREPRVDQGVSGDTPADYRARGIRSCQDNLRQALENLLEAEEWAKSISAVPDHMRPQLSSLVQKCRLVESELRNMK